MAIQRLLDRHMILVVVTNPEERVKMVQRPATAALLDLRRRYQGRNT